MTTICPTCQTVRPANTRVLATQCPMCGLTYLKPGRTAATSNSSPGFDASGAPIHGGVSWTRLGAILLLCVALVGGYRVYKKMGGSEFVASLIESLHGHPPPTDQASSDPASLLARLARHTSDADLAKLAANTQASDIVIYATVLCPGCALAKRWMQQHGFAYTECDIEQSEQCAQVFMQSGAQSVPYVIVRGQPIKDGFNSEDLVEALRKTQN